MKKILFTLLTLALLSVTAASACGDKGKTKEKDTTQESLR